MCYVTVVLVVANGLTKLYQKAGKSEKLRRCFGRLMVVFGDLSGLEKTEEYFSLLVTLITPRTAMTKDMW